MVKDHFLSVELSGSIIITILHKQNKTNPLISPCSREEKVNIAILSFFHFHSSIYLNIFVNMSYILYMIIYTKHKDTYIHTHIYIIRLIFMNERGKASDTFFQIYHKVFLKRREKLRE